MFGPKPKDLKKFIRGTMDEQIKRHALLLLAPLFGLAL